MSGYNIGNLINRFINYQALQNKAGFNPANSSNSHAQALPPAQAPQTSVSSAVSAATSELQMGNLSGQDVSAYVKDLMKLPKNLNELVYIIQKNITQAQFNQQFMNSLNKNMLTPTQAQILAQLQNLQPGEFADEMLKNMNSAMMKQLTANLKKLPINSSGLINLSDISLLIQNNGKDALTKLITTMANASKMGVNDLSQLKETAKLINASIATASKNDNAQTMKLLMLLYLPWLPLQEGTGFDLEIETNKAKSDSDSILTITITTINYGIVVATLILESSNSVHISIECSKEFPKDELMLRIEKEEKHYSVQSVLTFETSDKDKKPPVEKQEAKINMSDTNQINPYLLLMAHSVIRHTLEIDKNTSAGIVSHVD